jgi:hypothetical protein
VSRFVTWASLGAAAVLLGLAASFTRPFTGSADAVVAVGVVAVVGLVVVQRCMPTPPAVLARRGRWSSPGPAVDGGRPGWRWAVPAAPLVAALGWELVSYAGAPRSEHPTLSVLIDWVDTSAVGHAAMVVGWLALGWYLVTR